MNSTLFTYTSKNIGIMLSVSLGRVEHLQVFECPVAMWPGTSDTTLRLLRTFDGQ